MHRTFAIRSAISFGTCTFDGQYFDDYRVYAFIPLPFVPRRFHWWMPGGFTIWLAVC